MQPAAKPSPSALSHDGSVGIRMVLLWGCALALLLAGLWLRWPSVNYRSIARQDVYNSFAYKTQSYSDIASLFFRDRLRTHPRPFLDYPLEYPVGMGIFIYALNSATPLRPYMLVSWAALALCALVSLWLVGRIPHANRWLLALSPALALYVNLNWDFWGIVWLLLALLAYVRGRAAWSGALFAAAVWTKFFPIVLLPLAALVWVQTRQWRPLLRFSGAFGLASVLINGPLLLLKPDAWLYFFAVNQQRGREVNLWNIFDRYGLTTPQINTLSSVLLIGGLAVVATVLWRRLARADADGAAEQGHLLLIPMACAMIAWFFFINKVYSPQYSLWIAVLLAVAGAPPALAAIWASVDLLYYVASFNTLGLSQFEEAVDWFYIYTLTPAMYLREACLLIIVVWALFVRVRGYRLGSITPNL